MSEQELGLLKKIAAENFKGFYLKKLASALLVKELQSFLSEYSGSSEK